MKYTINFKKKVDKTVYNKVYKVLDLVFRYALGEYALLDEDRCKGYVLFSDEDAECELDRILEEVDEVFSTELKYETCEDDEDDEDDED